MTELDIIQKNFDVVNIQQMLIVYKNLWYIVVTV